MTKEGLRQQGSDSNATEEYLLSLMRVGAHPRAIGAAVKVFAKNENLRQDGTQKPKR